MSQALLFGEPIAAYMALGDELPLVRVQLKANEPQGLSQQQKGPVSPGVTADRRLAFNPS